LWPNAQAHLAEWRPENLATLRLQRKEEEEDSLGRLNATWDVAEEKLTLKDKCAFSNVKLCGC
jgi:hypothetical protein